MLVRNYDGSKKIFFVVYEVGFGTLNQSLIEFVKYEPHSRSGHCMSFLISFKFMTVCWEDIVRNNQISHA